MRSLFVCAHIYLYLDLYIRKDISIEIDFSFFFSAVLSKLAYVISLLWWCFKYKLIVITNQITNQISLSIASENQIVSNFVYVQQIELLQKRLWLFSSFFFWKLFFFLREFYLSWENWDTSFYVSLTCGWWSMAVSWKIFI